MLQPVHPLRVSIPGKAGPRLRRTSPPPRDFVHSIPEEVPAPVDDVSDMDSYSDEDSLCSSHELVLLVQHGLNLNCTEDSLEGAPEFKEKGVAYGLYLAAPVLLHNRPEHGIVPLEEFERERLVPLSHRGVTDQVGEHYRGQSTFGFQPGHTPDSCATR